MMNLTRAFVLRDLAIEKKYKVDFLARLGATFFQLVIFFFLSRVVRLDDYFTFVLVGVMFSRFFHFWMGVFAENARMEQYWGTAEAVFLSDAKPVNILFASASGKFILLCAELAVYFAAGKFIMGAALSLKSLMLFAPLFVFGIFVFAGFGLVSASFTVLFKRGDPFGMFVSLALDLFSGVYFPLSVFPENLGKAAGYLPTTLMLDGWRAVLGGGPAPGAGAVLTLSIWGAFFWVAGFVLFQAAYGRARKNGELGTY